MFRNKKEKLHTMVTKEEQSIRITDQQLHSALNDFLEEKEKKPEKSIWNFNTIVGLVLVFLSAGYVGHWVATDIFGLATLPIFYTIMKVAPYVGGVMLGVLLLTTFVKNKGQQKTEIKEKEKARDAYDNLDKFLYADGKGEKSKSSARTADTFKVSLSNKLMRSRSDKKIFGICGGLAKYLGINSTLMRVIFVAAAFLSSSTFILVYIILSFVIPKEPVSEMDEFKF